MSRARISCEKLAEIDLRRADGKVPSAAERELYERHLAECARCREEREALGALASDGRAGPLPDLDDIARRRYVDEVLGRFDNAGEQPRDRSPDIVGRPRRMLLVAASAIAAAAVLALILVAVFAEEQPQPAGAGEQVPAPEQLVGRVVLVAGESWADATVTVGQEFAAGGRLGCRSGTAVISLPTGVMAALEPGSDVSLRRLDGESLELQLGKGTLLVSATPGRSGPPLSVTTRAGVVTVTGTVLQIRDAGDEVEVRVIRGQIAIDDGVGGEPRSVGPAEVAVLGRPGVRPADEQESAAIWAGIGAFDLFDGSAASLVDVRSVPAGARVAVDGAYLGRTPLAAAVRAGHRRLELTLAGREPVREFVDVLAGQTLSRAFELRPASQLAEASAVDGGTTDAAAIAAPAGLAGAAAMLVRAQSLRSERDWSGAARAYRELIRRHPGSDEARSSRVSLGQIELSKLGRPARALKSFDSYLARAKGGPLALEALLGRARSLRAMGRSAEERAALQRFLDRYPQALQAAEVRARLEALSASDQGSGLDSAKK